jgi:hypothetical protein
MYTYKTIKLATLKFGTMFIFKLVFWGFWGA